MSDLFGNSKISVEPMVQDPNPGFTCYGFHKYSGPGEIVICIGRADKSENVVVKVNDPAGDSIFLLSSRELAQEGLRLHRLRKESAGT